MFFKGKNSGVAVFFGYFRGSATSATACFCTLELNRHFEEHIHPGDARLSEQRASHHPHKRIARNQNLAAMMDGPITNGNAAPRLHPLIPMNGGDHLGAAPTDRLRIPKDEEAFYSPEHLKERQERQARRDVLKQYREPLYTLPLNHSWEIPGR